MTRLPGHRPSLGEVRGEAETMGVCCLLACSPWLGELSYTTRITCPWVVLTTVGWTLLHQLPIKIISPPHTHIGQSDLHNPSILSRPGGKTKGDIHQIFDKCQLLLLYLLFPLFFSSFSPSPCYATFESHVLTNTRQEFYP